MALRYYGVNLGGGMASDVTEGAATTGKNIELVVDLSTAGLAKIDVLKAIEALEQRVTTDTWPPA